MRSTTRCLIILFVVMLASISLVGCGDARTFDGDRAMEHVENQCDLGDRSVGTEGNAATVEYIADYLERYGWDVEYQEFAYLGRTLCNVMGTKGEGPLIILGTHFDTRPVADRDPDDRAASVPGANDGASGTAVLLELARVLDETATDQATITLAFFDGEDRGDLNGWPWCVGSSYMAANLEEEPEYALVVDMVGDADQEFFYEWSSSLWLQEKIWGIADELGYGTIFRSEHRYVIEDDHTSFLQQGIDAAVIIDFDYRYWHTASDTPDKISADSLQRVGDVLEKLLEEEPF